MRRNFLAAVIAFAFLNSILAFQSHGNAQLLPDAGDLRLLYDETTGDLSMFYTGTGANGTAPLAIESYVVLTLGNATQGPAMPSGIPGVTAGQGGLNVDQATLPSPTGFAILNDDPAGENGIYSEIGDVDFAPIITFDKTNPGVSDIWNFGKVAPVGWSQNNINSIFVTGFNAGAGPTELNFGKFAYLKSGDGAYTLGTVAVPEPSTMLFLLAAGSIAAVSYTLRRLRLNQPPQQSLGVPSGSGSLSSG